MEKNVEAQNKNLLDKLYVEALYFNLIHQGYTPQIAKIKVAKYLKKPLKELFN